MLHDPQGVLVLQEDLEGCHWPCAGAVRGAGGGYFVSMLVLAAASLTTSLLSAVFPEPKKLKRRLSGELRPAAC